MSALSIRRDRTPAVLRKLAKGEADARVARRMLAIANALDGMSREAAAVSAGMDRQTLRDWVIRYNEHGLDGLADRPREGRPPTLEPHETAGLLQIVLAGFRSRSQRPLGVHARGPRRPLPGEVRPEPARLVDGPHPARPWSVATEGATEPSAQGPGRTSGL